MAQKNLQQLKKSIIPHTVGIPVIQGGNKAASANVPSREGGQVLTKWLVVHGSGFRV